MAALAPLLAILAAIAAPGNHAASRSTAQDEGEIRRVEAELCRAFETGDASVLRRDLDARFTLTNSAGEVASFEQTVAEVEKRDPFYDLFRNHDQVIRSYGDAAIVTGVTSVAGHSQDQPFQADFQFTDTWIRDRSGQWKLAASHASRVGK